MFFISTLSVEMAQKQNIPNKTNFCLENFVRLPGWHQADMVVTAEYGDTPKPEWFTSQRESLNLNWTPIQIGRKFLF